MSIDINEEPLSHKAVVVKKPLMAYVRIFEKIWVESLTMFANFAITFMLYPSVTTKKSLNVVKDQPAWNFFLFTLAFSTGDFSGRFVCDKVTLRFSRPFLVFFLASRILVIVTTFIMAFNDTNSFWNYSGVILANSFLIGFTNGFLTVASGCSFPDKLEDDEKEFGGFIISVMINFGIAMGSLLSLVAFTGLF